VCLLFTDSLQTVVAASLSGIDCLPTSEQHLTLWMLLSYSRQCGAVVWMVVLIGLTVEDNRKNPDSSHRQQSEQQRAVDGPDDAERSSGRPSTPRSPGQTAPKASRRTTDKPNIVFIITDDQDVEMRKCVKLKIGAMVKM
jgi:hypothetical protein